MDICSILNCVPELSPSLVSTQSWDPQNSPRLELEPQLSSQLELDSGSSTQSWDSQNGPCPQTEGSSTQSWDSQNSSCPQNESSPFQEPKLQLILPQTPRKQYTHATTRSDRIRIKTALDFNVPFYKIRQKYGFTDVQIRRARDSRLTPQKNRCGRKPLISTPKRHEIEEWILQSPSRLHLPWRAIPEVALDLHLDCKEQAMQTAFKLLGYSRRSMKKKGFSDDPKVMAERLAFAQWGITWTPERLYKQIFSDEVWAHGGAHTNSFITTKKDGSDRYQLRNVQNKYSRQPTWMFHGTIVNGGKGPALFWEKEWGNMKSSTYDSYILASIQTFIEEHNEGYIWMQDGASSHRSKETQANLHLRRIPRINWPRYSPDLNLIEHVWNWMKNWIQRHYWLAYYDAKKVPLDDLRKILWEAWDAVPDTYIKTLYDSWWRRCEAVIEAQGGPTKY
jgi:hypothetical protein